MNPESNKQAKGQTRRSGRLRQVAITLSDKDTDKQDTRTELVAKTQSAW